MSCTRADALLQRLGVTVRETVNAKQTALGPRDLARVFAGAKRLVASKGTSAQEFDLTHTKVSDPELHKRVIGPTGNLRAPTARLGATILVGFSETSWKAELT